MGYNASGDFEVQVTPEIETAFAIHPEVVAFAQSMNLHSSLSKKTLLLTLLDAVGFEVGETADSFDRPSEVTCYRGWFSNKWRDDVDTLIRLIAASGMGFDGRFRGEDDAAWRMSSELGVGTLDEDSIDEIPSKDLADLRSKACSLDAIMALLACPDADLTAVRALLP